jgi:hypothetical protein
MVSVFVVIDFVFIYAFDVRVCWWKPEVASFLYSSAKQHLHPVHCVYFRGQHSDTLAAVINRRLQEIGCLACSVLFIDLFLALSFWSQFVYFSFTVFFFSASLSGLYFLCMAKLLPFFSLLLSFLFSVLSFFHYNNQELWFSVCCLLLYHFTGVTQSDTLLIQ